MNQGPVTHSRHLREAHRPPARAFEKPPLAGPRPTNLAHQGRFPCEELHELSRRGVAWRPSDPPPDRSDATGRAQAMDSRCGLAGRAAFSRHSVPIAFEVKILHPEWNDTNAQAIDRAPDDRHLVAVRTSVGRAATEAYMRTLSDAGIDLVAVSGARRRCLLCRSGTWEARGRRRHAQSAALPHGSRSGSARRHARPPREATPEQVEAARLWSDTEETAFGSSCSKMRLSTALRTLGHRGMKLRLHHANENLLPLGGCGVRETPPRHSIPGPVFPIRTLAKE